MECIIYNIKYNANKANIMFIRMWTENLYFITSSCLVLLLKSNESKYVGCYINNDLS